MAEPNWKALDPYRPLAGSDVRYVPRPEGWALDLARMARVGMGGGRIAINGPAGVGKSTELDRAAAELATDRLVVRSQLDQRVDLRTADDHKILGAIVAELLTIVPEARPGDVELPRPTIRAESLDGAAHVLRTAAKIRGQNLVVLVDGLEKLEGPQVRAILNTLVELVGRAQAGLVVVLSPTAVMGSAAVDIVSRFKIVELRPVLDEASAFWVSIVERRIDVGAEDWPLSFRAAVAGAAIASGGLPRLFLQLLEDAVGYAALRGEVWPSSEDVAEATQDQMDTFRYLLEKGDLEYLKKVSNQGKDDVEASTRARLVAQGLLLAHGRGADLRYRAHPLLLAYVRRSG